jgi:hypothetical protein
MQIGDLSRELQVERRAIRYALERGHADRWVSPAVGKGHHLDLTPGEAFALALLLTLKKAGLRLPAAEQVVSLVEEGVRTIGLALGWEPSFQPFAGNLQTDHRWVAEIGDSEAFRMATDANPSRRGKLEFFDWVTIGDRRRVLQDLRPCVTIGIDLTHLAERLQAV